MHLYLADRFPFLYDTRALPSACFVERMVVFCQMLFPRYTRRAEMEKLLMSTLFEVEPWEQYKGIFWAGSLTHTPPAISCCLLEVWRAVLVTSECSLPLAAAINNPCHWGKQEYWKRLFASPDDLLYKYLLPFLMVVSPLKYKWLGSVLTLTPSPVQNKASSWVRPSPENLHTYLTHVCYSTMSVQWVLWNCFSKHSYLSDYHIHVCAFLLPGVLHGIMVSCLASLIWDQLQGKDIHERNDTKATS